MNHFRRIVLLNLKHVFIINQAVHYCRFQTVSVGELANQFASCVAGLPWLIQSRTPTRYSPSDRFCSFCVVCLLQLMFISLWPLSLEFLLETYQSDLLLFIPGCVKSQGQGSLRAACPYSLLSFFFSSQDFLTHLVCNLLEEGNAFFKDRQWEQAIKEFSEGLNVSDYAEAEEIPIPEALVESLYVNRAAAYHSTVRSL